MTVDQIKLTIFAIVVFVAILPATVLTGTVAHIALVDVLTTEQGMTTSNNWAALIISRLAAALVAISLTVAATKYFTRRART